MANGLPPLSSSILATIESIEVDALAAAKFASLLFGASTAYGIFNSSGAEALTGYNSVVGFNFQRDQTLVNAPVEHGGFQSYNKVALPFGAKLQYTVNGGPSVIAAFLANVEALVQDTNLYTVVMPEYAWQNVNAHHHDFTRSARGGFSMLTVDVWLQEIRQTAAPQYTTTNQTGTQASPTDTVTPDGQAQQNGGNVQPQTAPSNAPVPLTQVN